MRYRALYSQRRARSRADGRLQGSSIELSRWNNERSDWDILEAKYKKRFAELIEEITGLTFHQFTRSALLAQGNFSVFLKAKEDERSNALEAITGTEIYSRISQAVYERYKSENTALEHLKSSHLRIAVIGSGTARALEAHGMYAELMPEVYDGEHLGAALGEVLSDEHILIPRAKIGNPELIREIKKRSEAVIEDLPIYDTHYEAYGFINYQEEFEQGKTDYVMFTSASTVRGFAQAAKGLDFSKVQALCIGKQTKAAADHYGMQTFMAEQPTLEAMVALVKERKRTW